ncbi:MAG: hypothetical protein ACLQIQ_02775 [Beijerinckiaceae bacterium]
MLSQFLQFMFSGDAPIAIGGAALASQSLRVLGTTAVIVVALWLFFNRTLAGKAILALSAVIGAIGAIPLMPITIISHGVGLMLSRAHRLRLHGRFQTDIENGSLDRGRPSRCVTLSLSLFSSAPHKRPQFWGFPANRTNMNVTQQYYSTGDNF